MGTTKRQLSFYAESDVDLYLSLLGSGIKTRVLNEAIRMKMSQDAKVNLNDGTKPVFYSELTEADQNEVHSNLIREELSLNDVDDQIWEIVRETASNSWKQNTRRYLALHQAKFQEPFRIKKMRSQQERDEAWHKRPPTQSYFYCNDHAPNDASKVLNLEDKKCCECGESAWFRKYK